MAAVSAAASGVSGLVRSRLERWRPLLQLLPRAGTGTVTAAIVVNLLIGALPIAFIVAMSVVLHRIGQPAASGPRWQQASVAFLLAGAAFVGQQLLVPFQVALGEVVGRRVDGHCIGRLMRSALRDAPVATLERPEVLDMLSDSRTALDRAMPTPGDAVAGVLALVARYTQLVGAVTLVAVMLSPAAGLVIATTALVLRFGQRGSLARFSQLMRSLAGRRRAMAYVREVASSPAAGKDIRVFGLAGWLRDREHAEAHDYLEPLWRGRRRILFRPFLGYAVIGLLGGCLTLVLLARASAHGELGLLELAVTVQAVLIPMRFGVYFPESDVQTQYGSQGYRALVRFETAARAERPTGGSRTASAPTALRQGIRFENVSFRYGPAGPDVLHGLDLELPAGTSTGLVGLNGAGKTTLVKLLARLHDPTAGRITVDGQDLTEIDPREWQARLAIIFQDYVRYELSAAENIAYGAPAFAGDRDGIRRAAGRAGILPALDALPDGLDTVLSRRYPGGRDLSGGQWQRVALARGFFAAGHGAPVLVLDEPTAQLDVRAEVEFYDQFLGTTAGLTSVIISHRFSTVRKADQIVVLEHGRVVERGDHPTLLRSGGRYAHLFHLQARRFGDPTEEDAP